MRTHFPWRESGYAVGGLTLLLALYVGSYWATVTQQQLPALRTVPNSVPVEETVLSSDGSTKTRVIYHKVQEVIPCTRIIPAYPFPNVFGSALNSFYAPIHDLDRRFRPEVWPEVEGLYETEPSAPTP